MLIPYLRDESLAARFADFWFHAWALSPVSPEEILHFGRQDLQPGLSR